MALRASRKERTEDRDARGFDGGFFVRAGGEGRELFGADELPLVLVPPGLPLPGEGFVFLPGGVARDGRIAAGVDKRGAAFDVGGHLFEGAGDFADGAAVVNEARI